MPPSVLYVPAAHERGDGQLVVRSETTAADGAHQHDATPVEIVVTSDVCGALQLPLAVPGPAAPMFAVAESAQPPAERLNVDCMLPIVSIHFVDSHADAACMPSWKPFAASAVNS